MFGNSGGGLFGNSNTQPTTQFGAPQPQFGAPQPQFGAPPAQFGAPPSQFGATTTQFGASFGAQSGTPFGGGGANTGTSLFGGVTTPTPGPSLFGGVSAASQGSNLFGGSNPPSGGQGQGQGQGQGLFGAAQTVSAFGMPSAGFGGTTGGSLFGGQAQTQPSQPTSLFGNQPAQSSGGIFGGLGNKSQGPTSLFGGAPNPQQPSPFSLNAPSQPANPGGMFGGGSTSTGGGIFGAPQQPMNVGFGQPPVQQTLGFLGGQNQQQQQPPQQPSLFGGATGVQQQTGGIFGGMANTAQKQGGLFGQSQPSQQPTSGFGFGAQQPATSMFGGPAQNTGGIFGASTTGTGGFLGQPMNANKQNTGTPIGGGFMGQNTGNLQQMGSQSMVPFTNQPFQAKKAANETLSAKGEKNTVFSISNGTDSCIIEICLLQRKLMKSGQLQQGMQQQPGIQSMFGQQQPVQQTGIFGAQTNTQQPTGSLFGNIGQTQQQGGSLFGSTQQPSQFGQAQQPASSAGLFGGGQGGPLFGQAPSQGSQTSGLFGMPATSSQTTGGGLFGVNPPPVNTGGMFNTAQQAPQTTGGLFGQQVVQAQQGQTGQGGLFGITQPSSSLNVGGQSAGLFGVKPQTTALFGAQQNVGQTGGLFGQAAPFDGGAFSQQVQGQQQTANVGGAFTSLMQYLDMSKLSEQEKKSPLDEDIETHWVLGRPSEEESLGYYQRADNQPIGQIQYSQIENSSLYGYQKKQQEVFKQFQALSMRDNKIKKEDIKKTLTTFSSGGRSALSNQRSEQLSTSSVKSSLSVQEDKEKTFMKQIELGVDYMKRGSNVRIRIPIKTRHTFGDVKQKIISKYCDDINEENVRNFRLQACLKGSGQHSYHSVRDSDVVTASTHINLNDIDYLELIEKVKGDRKTSRDATPILSQNTSQADDIHPSEPVAAQSLVVIPNWMTCYPSKAQLEQMNSTQIQCVHDFCIENENVKIVFEEPVNLLGMDLSELVLQESKISLENIKDSDRLNKPCTIHFKKFGKKQLDSGKSQKEVSLLVSKLVKKMKLDLIKPYDVENTSLLYRQDNFNSN